MTLHKPNNVTSSIKNLILQQKVTIYCFQSSNSNIDIKVYDQESQEDQHYIEESKDMNIP